MPYCSILQCRNDSRKKNLSNSDVSYHRFPKDPVFKEKWIDATGRVNWMPSNFNTICSEHFVGDNLLISKKGYKYLTPTAIPTLKIMNFFIEQQYIDNVSTGSKNDLNSPTKKICMDNNFTDTYKVKQIEHANPAHAHSSVNVMQLEKETVKTLDTLGQISTCLNPKKINLKGHLRFCENKIKKQALKIKGLQLRNRGLRKKMNVKNEILKKLEEQNVMATENLECLNNTYFEFTDVHGPCAPVFIINQGNMGEAVNVISDPLSKTSDDCGPSCTVKCWKWDVSEITMKKALASHTKYAVLILNRPIPQNPGFVKRLWNNAAIRMTVDGGTKQWDKFLSSLSDDMKKGIKEPDLVTGDFDSITEEILEKYKKKGCKAIHTPDQDYTDFTKALIELNIYSNRIGVELSHVIAVAQASGRLDQILGNVQTLFLAREKILLSLKTSVYILSDDSISWLLYPGDHVIYVPEESRKHKRAWCSLVPIGEACQHVTSTGLKWNLDHQPLKFGGIVSTSNTFDGSEKVTIKCSETLLWSMRVPSMTMP